MVSKGLEVIKSSEIANLIVVVLLSLTWVVLSDGLGLKVTSAIHVN
jgi:hypothetical protein